MKRKFAIVPYHHPWCPADANFYATMAEKPIDTFYCTETTLLQLEELNAEMDVFSSFPSVEFKKRDAEIVCNEFARVPQNATFPSPGEDSDRTGGN